MNWPEGSICHGGVNNLQGDGAYEPDAGAAGTANGGGGGSSGGGDDAGGGATGAGTSPANSSDSGCSCRQGASGGDSSRISWLALLPLLLLGAA